MSGRSWGINGAISAPNSKNSGRLLPRQRPRSPDTTLVLRRDDDESDVSQIHSGLDGLGLADAETPKDGDEGDDEGCDSDCYCLKCVDDKIKPHGWWRGAEMTTEEADDLVCSMDGLGNVG